MILPLVSVLPSSGHIGENLTAESLQMSEYFPLISVSLVSEKHADQSTTLLNVAETTWGQKGNM